VGWKKKSRYKRDKYTLPSRVEVGDTELFWHNPYEFIEGPDETFIEKIVEWLQNFKVNFETIGFERTVEDLPRIKGSALVIDHPFTGTLDRHLKELKEYEGTVLVTDRALWKVLPYKTPDIVANIDSSYLCISFFDRPDVKKHMKEINAVFAATTHPLTIRAWTSKTRYFFMPWLGSSYLTYNLAAMGGLPVLYTGGEVSTLIWLLAVNLGAKKIGMLAIDNCVPPDTRVITNPEVKMISQIKAGEKVLTHLGRFKRVKKVYRRPYNGNLVIVKVYGSDQEISLTPEHPVLVMEKYERHQRSKNGKKYYEISVKLPKWVKARDLSKKYALLHPIISITRDVEKIRVSSITREKNVIKLDNGMIKTSPRANPIKDVVKVSKDFMRLCGYYLAEGCVYLKRGIGRIVLVFNKKEEQYAKDVMNLFNEVFGIRANKYYGKNVIRIQVGSRILAAFFKTLFGNKSTQKHMPSWFLTLPIDKQAELIKGFWRGDGCLLRKGYEFASASETLIIQLWQMLLRNGIVGNLHIRKSNTDKIEGRKTAFSPSVEISIVNRNGVKKFGTITSHIHPIVFKPIKRTWTIAKIFGNYLYMPIREVQVKNYQGYVYNLEVEDDETYVANRVVVHNCFHSIEETEYPGVPHEIWEINPWTGKRLPRTAYVDPVYKQYAEVHHALIKYAKEKHGVETYNCSPESGIMHAPWITDMPLKEFVRKFR